MQQEFMETLYKNKSRELGHLDTNKLRSWGIKIDEPKPV